MTQREKLLSILVGICMISVVAYAGWSRVSKMFQTREANIETLLSQKAKQERTLLKARRANRDLVVLRKRSLPADLSNARTSYRQWLLDVGEEIGLQPKVTPKDGANLRGQSYKEMKFQIDCKTTLHQLTQLLHRFYESDDLHRIQTLNLKPQADSKQFALTLSIEAIALPDAVDRKTVGDLKSKRLDGRPVEEFVQSIVHRNIFGQPNAAPKLDRIRRKTVEIGETMKVELKAEDDEKDKLTYTLEGEDLPEGLEIDEKESIIRWRPRREAEFKVTVKVTDDGFPALSDTTTFEVVARKPRVEKKVVKEEFDDSEFAFIIGTFEEGGERELWLNIRTKGKVKKLQVGDNVSVGTFRGKISKIGLSQYEFETENGLIEVGIGQSLKEGRRIDQPLRSAKKG